MNINDNLTRIVSKLRQIEGLKNILLYTIIGLGHTETKAQVFHETINRHFNLNQYHFEPTEVYDIEKTLDNICNLKLRGLTITFPYKQQSWEYIKNFGKFGDWTASRIGAINTIINEQGLLIGWNTDVLGFCKSLMNEGVSLNGRIVSIIGCGGMGRAVAFGSAEEKAKEIRLFDIDFKKQIELKQSLTTDFPYSRVIVCDQIVDVLTGSEIIVQCTPVGMKGNSDSSYLTSSPVPKELLRPSQIVVDSVYVPLHTKLIKDAREVGCKIISGVEIVLYGGIAQNQLYSGRTFSSDDALMAYLLGKKVLLKELVEESI